MLAGRKLLLADDSVTIQKVIDLTFADEGVEVIAVGDGTDAIEKVEQLLPDVVLADVFMPGFNGYEVCEYIKSSEKLKHIPVMLLVGSFEPFDEAEARRVGANDILTKPFQSIRRLIEKVGDLVSGKPPEIEVNTAELPKTEPKPEPTLSTAELEMTTADTLQLPADLAHQAHQAHKAYSAAMESSAAKTVVGENKMVEQAKKNSHSERTDAPLELEELEATNGLEADDFELELDLDEHEAVPVPAYSSVGYSETQAVRSAWDKSADVAVADNEPVLANPMVAAAPDVTRYGYDSPLSQTSASERIATQVQQLTDENLSQEMIDRIARRAVEMLSEKVVQEIAWEVVPQLAELMIKRRLEEQQSQHR